MAADLHGNKMILELTANQNRFTRGGRGPIWHFSPKSALANQGDDAGLAFEVNRIMFRDLRAGLS